MLAAFFVVLGVGSGDANWYQLTSSDWSGAGRALPIIFLTLVYHDLVPYVCDRLEYDPRKIRASLTLGTAVPLLLFLGWEAVALALTAGLESEVDPVGFITAGSSGVVATAIKVFSASALSTSAIGACVAAKQYIANEFRYFRAVADDALVSDGRVMDTKVSELAVLLLVLLPGTKTAIDNPSVFIVASKFAGAYGSSCLYGLLPPLMAMKLGFDDGDSAPSLPADATSREEPAASVEAYAPGGLLSCVVLGASALGIAVDQVLH